MTARDIGKCTAAVAATPPEAGAEKRIPRALGIAVAVAGLGLILDQGTKAFATGHLQPGSRVPLIGDLLSLSLVYNPGAAFSIGSGTTWLFTIIGVLIVAVMTGFAVLLRGARWGIALGLVLGGAVGNLVDRLVKPPSFGQGHVTDFIAYGHLFVGNVADVLVVVGMGLLCILLVMPGQRPAHTTENTP
jgi:signal peptidase II